jgi:hypothetical protein
MIKLLLQLIATLSISSICVAQTPVFEWARGTGGTDLDYSPSIKTDQLGNVYTTGTFTGTVDFDTGAGVYSLTSSGIFDAYIKKVDAAGNFLWAHSYGSTGGVQGKSIDIDDNGNVYVAGTFRYAVDFNPGTGTDIITSVTSIDGFILKLNANGDFRWVKSFAGRLNYISYDGIGNVYTTGWYSNTVDFDPGVGVLSLTSNGGADVFVHKMDTAGTFGWVKTFGGSDNDNGRALSFDNMGNVHLVGSFKSTVDFDPGVGVLNKTSAGDSDAFIQKLDLLGNLVWVKTFGNVGSDGITGIELDNSNHIITTGIFTGTIDFDPNPTVTNLTGTGTYASFIQKLDAAGNFQWVKGFMGTGTDYVRTYGMALDQFDNIYTIGAFNGAIDFDPNASTNIISGSHAGVINKIDNNGNLDFALVVGDPGCEGISITVDLFDNILCTGGFENTSDFNPLTGVHNLTNQGNSDEFILKIAQCFPTSSTINPSACDSYISPSGNYVWTYSNTYLDTIMNVGGCDSIITINLTINNSSTSILNETACDSYTSPSGNYVWTSSNTYIDTISNAVNCDSIITINLTINNSSTSTINETACGSYTSPSGNYVWTSSNTYLDTVVNVRGCDSVIMINLTINNATVGTDVQVACDSYLWIDGNTYTTNNTTATHTLVNGNATGCDSVVTLDLTINTVDVSTTSTGNDSITSNAIAATYQWLDCNDNFSIIAGETNALFVSIANGSYAVEVTQNGCIDTSTCHSLTITGLVENNFEKELLIYPNPTQGNFSIDLGKSYNVVRITMTDLNGILIQSKTYNDSELLNLKLEEPAGVYLLIIESEERKAVIRLVKE